LTATCSRGRTAAAADVAAAAAAAADAAADAAAASAAATAAADVYVRLGSKHTRLRDMWVQELGSLPQAVAPAEMLQVTCDV
jgi:hypothetical protein